MALTVDGRKVAAGSRDGTVHLWTLDPPGTRPLALAGHTGTVTGVAFGPDGSTVLSAGVDGVLRIWDATSGEGEELLAGRAGAIRAVACSRATGGVALAGDRLVLRDSDGRIQTLAGHEGGALCVAFSADGGYVVSGGRDEAVRVWRMADGTEVATFDGHVGAVRAVAFGPDRRHIYSGGADGTGSPVASAAGRPGGSRDQGWFLEGQSPANPESRRPIEPGGPGA